MSLRRSTRNPIRMDELERYVEFMKKHDLSELRIEEGRDNRLIVLRRGQAEVSYTAPAAGSGSGARGRDARKPCRRKPERGRSRLDQGADGRDILPQPQSGRAAGSLRRAPV